MATDLKPAAGRGEDHRVVAMIGFMGAGKSTAARSAAQALGAIAVDVDNLVQERLGSPSIACSPRTAKPRFEPRRSRSPSSCSTPSPRGRGAGCSPWAAARSDRSAVREALAGHLVTWIDIDAETAWMRCQGSGRPLAAERSQFERLYAEREPIYDQLADLVVPHERAQRMGEVLERRRRTAARRADAVGGERVGRLPGLHRSGPAGRATVLAGDGRGAALSGRRRCR